MDDSDVSSRRRGCFQRSRRWNKRPIHYKCASLSLFCVTLIVLYLGLTVVLISSSSRHLKVFEAAGISELNCSQEVLLSSLTIISFVVILALETSAYFGVSQQWRFHVNTLELVWSSLMLLSWLISLTANSLDWHHLAYLPNEAQRLINDVQVSAMRENYVVASYANSIIWASLVCVYLHQSNQVKHSFKMYCKWLLMVIMCFTFGLNAYLIIHAHIVMQRNINSTYLPFPYQIPSTVTGTAVGDGYITTHFSPSLPMEKQNCSWPNTRQNQKRREFCKKYFWYTDICRCNSPINFEITPTKLASPNNIADVPVAVIASDRTQCLSRALYYLLSADGANASMTNVFLDGHFQEQVDVCKLFGVNYTIHDIHYSRHSKNSFRITEHYRVSLTKMFNYYPTARSIIILEDDLLVSPDFFSYFSQTAPLLDKDHSLYCISAWNDFAYQHASKDPSLLYRVDTMPGLGWLLKRSLYKGELEAKWPNESEPLTWDLWMREPEQRKGRECIIPDVARTFHFAPGTHIGLDRQRRHFLTRSFNVHRHVKFKDLHWLIKDAYEQTIHQLIRSAKLVDHALTPCSKQLIPNTTNEYYVIYLEHTDLVFIRLMKCFRLWDIDIRADHNNMWRFWYKENHIVVLRCPLSPYCVHMPSHISPLTESLIKIRLMFWRTELSFSARHIKRRWQQKMRRRILVNFYLAALCILLVVCVHKLIRYLTKRVKHKLAHSSSKPSAHFNHV